MLQQAMRQRVDDSPELDGLKHASVARDFRAVRAIIRRKPKLASASDALGNTAIHWSVLTRQLSFIEYFLARGTSIDAQRADGQTPITLAVNGATDYWFR